MAPPFGGISSKSALGDCCFMTFGSLLGPLRAGSMCTLPTVATTPLGGSILWGALGLHVFVIYSGGVSVYYNWCFFFGWAFRHSLNRVDRSFPAMRLPRQLRASLRPREFSYRPPFPPSLAVLSSLFFESVGDLVFFTTVDFCSPLAFSLFLSFFCYCLAFLRLGQLSCWALALGRSFVIKLWPMRGRDAVLALGGM